MYSNTVYLLPSDWAAIGVGEAAEEVREVVLVKFVCQGVVEGDVHNLSGSFRPLSQDHSLSART